MPFELTNIASQLGGAAMISAYGDGGFRILDQRYEGSLLIGGGQVISWPVTSLSEMTFASFAPLFSADPDMDFLVIGCGSMIAHLDPDLRAALKEKGIALEVLDTGAACRTYNFLLTEGRRIGAALIAI